MYWLEQIVVGIRFSLELDGEAMCGKSLMLRVRAWIKPDQLCHSWKSAKVERGV